MKTTSAKKNKKTTILLFLVLFAGLSLLLYPSVSDYWNSFRQTRAIAAYIENVAELDDDSYDELWREAQEYNVSLSRSDSRFFPREEEEEVYKELLNVAGNGIMGYVEIPSIDVSLPVYHGTDDEILQVAVGHIEGSSLPVGGEGTHSVISGHRGLPSAKLFTDLDQMTEGDVFMLHVLDETLTYQVEQIHIVEPEDLSFLEIREGEDWCTLITCTPYGVNSHRLLVQGRRIENQGTASFGRVTADAVLMDRELVAVVLAIPVLIVLLLWVLFCPHKKESKR